MLVFWFESAVCMLEKKNLLCPQPVMTSKICKRCSKSKPLDNFRVTTNGVTTHCISCLDEKNA